jgi:hypothetical protein
MSDDPADDPKQTRAEYYRAIAEAAERQARKAGSATAMFALLDAAEHFRQEAAKAELEEKIQSQSE